MLYALVCSIFTIYLRLFTRWRVVGADRMPRQGAVIVCANHYHWMDPVVIACANRRRQIHFMAKDELFRIRILAFLFRLVNAYPVKRGAADRNAVKTTLTLLEKGNVVGIFPEGTRSRTGELGKGEPGIGLFAHRTQATIVPVGIAGSYRPFRRITVVYGEPMRFEQAYEQKLKSDELQRAITEPVMAEVAALRAAAKATLQGTD